MEQTSFHGSKDGIIAVLVLLVLTVGITFSSIRMNIDGKIDRYKHEAAVLTSEMEKENQLEIEGY